MKANITNPILETWSALNAYVMVRAEETDCEQLLAEELHGRRRKKFLLRIHSRLNKLRADRERAEIMEQIR